ncbi:SDR family NAD(P)-dependent oxidoreductase, partial [Acinetobacter baumannii]
MDLLNGKVVLVTGAGAGLGRVAARLYARQGARLAVAARSPETLE